MGRQVKVCERLNIGKTTADLEADAEWEGKQRAREYRVAARREKRNRKADEKKQRKLNATILRRMTRNPDKYNKNAERNRFRDIESERRRIWSEAIKQAQRLAAVHDPSGATFNVVPVTTQEDGTVIALETLRKRQEKAAAKLAEHVTVGDGKLDKEQETELVRDQAPKSSMSPGAPVMLPKGINPDRLALMDVGKPSQQAKKMSKTQQKKLEALAPRPTPPKPVIPDGVQLLEGEENWLALWDLSDEQLERRVMREKKRKAAERKALRVKQQEGKAERRAARDEKRRVYREIKLTWKAIKGRTLPILAVEQEEIKKIAIDINTAERKAALERCAELGFTLKNTSGVDEIKPRAMGMKGVEVEFDNIQLAENATEVNPSAKSKRVDLGVVADDSRTQLISTGQRDGAEEAGDFIELDVGDDQDFEGVGYNHKLRRKLRRAIEAAEIRKEMLVRQKALEHCLAKDIEPPTELQTPHKPMNVRGQRVLEDGTLETAKQERVRSRMELAEYNKAARVLRKQAKQIATEAGLRKFAELTGAVPNNISVDLQREHTRPAFGNYSSTSSSDEYVETKRERSRKRTCRPDSDSAQDMENTKKRYRTEETVP
ncbi:MAG: hypothetical protein M1830_001679 [Pleopsidium flavum]|nr:MAG: hypothetical protein M1830_001679 [Pleopsidium flavum]